VALRKPSSYFGDDKKPEVNNSHQRESTPLSFAGTFDGIIESVYLKIKDLTDEQIEFIKDDVFKIYSLVDNLVEHELPNYKKQSMGATIQLDRKISDVKESLAIQLQEHIAETRSTIQTSLLENGLKKYDKTISALSTDLKVVERFISENAKDIVSLKEEVTKELEKATVSIPLIEERLREIKESYEGLTSKQLLTEGGLNEPPNVNNEDPLTPLDQNFVTFEQLQKHYQLFINRIQQQMATIGGGGETQLKYLDDIVGIATNASAYDGKFLRYNHGLKKFVFEDAIPQANETQALHSVLGYGNSSTRGMTVGVSTFSNAVIVGGATTELVVNGDARITGILTIGTASVTIDGVNNVVTASSYNGSGAALTGITTGQIVDFIGFATEGFVSELDVAVLDYVDNYAIPGLSTVYTTESYVDNALVGYATEGYVVAGDTLIAGYIDTEIAGLSTVYTTESYVDNSLVGYATEGYAVAGDISIVNYIDNYAIPGLSTVYATQESIVGLVTSGVVSGYATEGYVDTAVAGIVSSAPTTLDTLQELAQALGDDPNFATTTANLIGTKASLNGDTFTGVVTATSFSGDGANITGISTANITGFAGHATESYVDNAVSGVSTFSGDYNDLSNKPTIPADTGDLTNNAGFVTSGIVVGYATETFVTNALVGYATEGYVDSAVSGVSTFSGDYNDLSNKPTIPADTGDLTNNVGFVTSGVVDGYATETYVDNAVSGVSTFSGDYNDLSNKPIIPSDVGELTNNVGFVTSGVVDGYATETYVDNAVSGISTDNVRTSTLEVAGFSTFQSHVHLGDDDELRFGAGNDFKIYHDPDDARLENTNGDIKFKNTGSYFFFDEDGGETLASFINDGAVNLYHDNSKKFETTAGGVSIDGGIQESFTTLTSSTGTVTHDCSAAQLFYHTSPSANFTVNLTNLALSQEYATTVTIVINQGDPAYMVTGLQIGGSAQTIKWQGNNSAPNGTASGIDVVTFRILNDGGTYVVLAQSVPFGGV